MSGPTKADLQSRLINAHALILELNAELVRAAPEAVSVEAKVAAWWKRYAKGLLGTVGTVITVLLAQPDLVPSSVGHWLSIASGALTALGVVVVPNAKRPPDVEAP